MSEPTHFPPNWRVDDLMRRVEYLEELTEALAKEIDGLKGLRVVQHTCSAPEPETWEER